MKTEPLPRRHRQLHRVQHGHPRLPGATSSTPGRRAARLPRQRRTGARARRRVRRQRPGAAAICRSTARPRTPTASTCRSRTRRRRSRRPAGRRPRTSRVPLCPASREWALSLGGEYATPATHARPAGRAFRAASTPATARRSRRARAPSRYLVVDGYALLNARVGFRWADGWSVSVWSRNLLDKDYFELLSAAPGGSGLYVGLPGEPRTVGITLRISLGPD